MSSFNITVANRTFEVALPIQLGVGHYIFLDNYTDAKGHKGVWLKISGEPKHVVRGKVFNTTWPAEYASDPDE